MPFQFEPVGTDGKQAAAAKVLKVYAATNFSATTAEGMITLTPYSDGVAGAAATSFIITSGKRFVPISLSALTKNAGAAVQGLIARLRSNPAGATIVTSAILAIVGAGTSVATANVVGGQFGTLVGGWPTLMEIQGDGTKSIGISQMGTATAGNDVVLMGYEY